VEVRHAPDVRIGVAHVHQSHAGRGQQLRYGRAVDGGDEESGADGAAREGFGGREPAEFDQLGRRLVQPSRLRERPAQFRRAAARSSNRYLLSCQLGAALEDVRSR